MQGNPSSVTRKMSSHVLPDGREIVLCSFGLAEWAAVQEAALSHYKRSVIKTWTDNADLLPPEVRDREIRRVFQEVEKLTTRGLPRQMMQMPVLDDQGEERLDEHGKVMLHDVEMDFVSWWISDTREGQLYCVWLSARKVPGQESWTKDYVSELYAISADDLTAGVELDKTASTVARISNPDADLLKNSSAPPQPTAEGMSSQTAAV